MTKTMRKTLALLLIAVMVLNLLIGCGGAAVSTPAQENPSGGGTAPSGTTAETKPAEPAAQEQSSTGLMEIEMQEVETAVTTYHEAPVLAEKVAKGELPPVEERIPNLDNVFIETNATDGAALEIGNYGGILSYATTSTGSWEIARLDLQRQVEFNSDGSAFFNFLKDIQVSEDFKTYTFYFREGVRWSDGVPFTTDDVTFWYYMLHKNNYDKVAYWENLYQWVDGVQVWADLKKVDDFTVTWTFAEPQSPANFYLQADFKVCWAPEHFFRDKVPTSMYMENPYWPDTGLTDEEVLKNYLRDGLEFETVAKAGDCIFKSWNYYAVPTMNAYMLTDVEGFRKYQDNTCILLRNPYFWKVDAQGNQLPYIDEIHINKVSDFDQATLMLQSGEVDYIKGVPVDKVNAILDAMGDRAEEHEVKSVAWGHFQIDFNITHPDEQIRALLSNVDFRRAVSVCVDREQVVNLWFDGLALPTNWAPQYPNFGYNEEWAYQYTQYDVALAKQLLEEKCGLVMGDDGYYNFADGRDLELVFQAGTNAQYAEKWAVLEKYYKAAGLKIELQQTDDTENLQDTNQWDMCLGGTAVEGYKIESKVKNFVPMYHAASWYSMYDYQGSAAGYYDLDGALVDLYNVYLEWRAIPDLKDRDGKELEMMKILVDNLYCVSYCSDPSDFFVASSKLKNMPKTILDEDKFQYQLQFRPWCMYFEQ